jgi:hypothetical protein
MMNPTGRCGLPNVRSIVLQPLSLYQSRQGLSGFLGQYREVHGTSLKWSERSSNAFFMAAVFSGVRGSSHSPRSLAAAAKMSCKTFAESETSAFVFLTTASTIRITVCAKHVVHEGVVGARDVLGMRAIESVVQRGMHP